MLVLKEPFASLWKKQDPFTAAFAVEGKIFRQKEGRKTLQFTLQNKSYFMKYHGGVGWKEVIKNLSQLRLPIIGAANEFHAANKLAQRGLDTLSPVAFGKKGINPARQQSFLITHDLVNTTSLEDYCRHWKVAPPDNRIKKSLIKRLAAITRIMHKAGVNHRDYYLCHFLLENAAEQKIINGEPYQCSLIDLHRSQIRRKVPQRWLLKDLAGLYYSTMDIGLNRKDLFIFLKHYTGLPLKEVFENKDFWRKVDEKARALYLKDFARLPDKLF